MISLIKSTSEKYHDCTRIRQGIFKAGDMSRRGLLGGIGIGYLALFIGLVGINRHVNTIGEIRFEPPVHKISHHHRLCTISKLLYQF